jgi:hypothetical protein
MSSNPNLEMNRNQDLNTAQENSEEQQPQFNMTISTDNMAAYLKVIPAYKGQTVQYEQVMDFLKQNKIDFGIRENAIRDFCREGKFYSELLCAKGIYPEDGKDGSMEYLFDTNSGLTPKERDDGTVDFRNLDIVKNVKQGEVLCQITPPTQGKDGIDIYNHVVHYKKGFTPKFPTGKNTIVSEDGLKLTAAVDGCIEYKNSMLNVNDVFIVRGDVDSASGNINAIGSVIVMGDVREGFSVKTQKDISIRGMAEGALIEAGGTISISKGMNGMGKGTLRAGGNIVGKYFENAILISENDIYADVLMNCRATAHGSIVLKGRKASLIGGSYQAEKIISAKNIGTPSYATTYVTISSKKLNEILATDDDDDKLEELQRKLTDAEKTYDDFQKNFSNLASTIPIGKRATGKDSMIIKTAIIRKSQLAGEVKSLKEKVRKLSEKKNNLTDFKIIGLSYIYTGTKMKIGPYKLNINNDYSNTKFYANNNEIVFAPVLPSDIVN